MGMIFSNRFSFVASRLASLIYSQYSLCFPSVIFSNDTFASILVLKTEANSSGITTGLDLRCGFIYLPAFWFAIASFI